MDYQTIARRYLDLLGRGDMTGVTALFAPEGRVTSPLYGQLPAAEFYQKLGADTSNSRLVLHELYQASSPRHWAMVFEYHWTMRNGKAVQFKVVDLLEFNEAYQLLHLEIIYDTVQARALLNALS